MATAGIVVVNWNSGAILADCLAAVQAQTLRGFTLVVVDNGSEDDSHAAVGSLADPRFRLLRLPRNTGFAAACNAGVRELGAVDCLALLNPDAFPEPGWLEALLRAAAEHPEVAAFGSLLLSAGDGGLSDGTGDEYHVSGRAWRRDHGAPAARAASRPEGPIFAPCAAAALYRRSAWEEAGGLDEDFFCYMEDVDLGFRLRLRGWECLHVPQAVCRHIGSATTGRRSDFTAYHGQRNLVWVFVKNMPTALLLALLPLHVLLNVAALLWLLPRGQFGVALRAKRDALLGLPGAWRKRREVQSRRTVPAAQVWRWLDKRAWPQP